MSEYIKNMTIHRTFVGILAFLVLVFISADQAHSATAKKGKKNSPKTPTINLRARAALVMDTEIRLILYSKNLTEKRPIASLTKLMTALVFLDTSPDLGEPLILQYEDRAPRGGKSLFRAGETFHLMDLLYAALMMSALQDSLISQITSTKQYTIRSLIRRRKIVLQNTCRLLNYRPEILGAKTGFIDRKS